MKKKLIAFIIAAIMLLSTLAGCTASPKPIADPTTANPVTEAPVTEAPTPEPTPEATAEASDHSEEEKINAAWAAAERIGELYGIRFDKDSADCVVDQVTFTDDACRQILVGLKTDGDGNLAFDPAMSAILWNGESEEHSAWSAKYKPGVWAEEYMDFEMVLTAEEIHESGCTVESGSEYLEAVGRCFAQKVADLFKDAPDDSPMCCEEIVIKRAERSLNAENAYLISFSALPADPLALAYFLDMSYIFDDGTAAPERFGWIDFGGQYKLTQRDDGSWVGSIFGTNDAA